jgi:hypothetical protein
MWFDGAMERILTETMAPIRADIQVMKDDIRDMKDDIRDIRRVQGQIWKLAARVSDDSFLIPPLLMTHSKNHNLCAGAGDNARLEVVPFTNGRDPTKDPVSFCLSPTSATS